MWTPEAVDNEVMSTLMVSDESVRTGEFGVFLEPERTVSVVPRGRVGGLFTALAKAVCRLDTAEVLPDIAIHDVRTRRPMFDYDPDLALTLDMVVA